TVLRLLAALAAEGVAVDLHALYGQETRVVGHAHGEMESRGRQITVPVGGAPSRPPVPQFARRRADVGRSVDPSGDAQSRGDAAREPMPTRGGTRSATQPALASWLQAHPAEAAVALVQTGHADGCAHAAYLDFADVAT